jgi:hypothetical protein
MTRGTAAKEKAALEQALLESSKLHRRRNNSLVAADICILYTALQAAQQPSDVDMSIEERKRKAAAAFGGDSDLSEDEDEGNEEVLAGSIDRKSLSASSGPGSIL